MIVDVRRIEAGDGNVREQLVEETGAGVGKFVEDKRCAGHLGEDGEQAGAGRRLQHEIAGRERGREAGDKAERDRRRELLKRLALFGAARVRGQQAASLPSMASCAAGVTARARMAGPNLRRNSTCAASQAS